MSASTDLSGSTRRDFLAASAGVIASAFLPASLLALCSARPGSAKMSREALLPPIPRYGSNPYAGAAIEQLKAVLEEEKTAPFPGFSRSTAAAEVGAAGEETLELIRAYNYEESALKGSEDCLKAIIARCDCIYSYARALKPIDDYAYVAPLAEIMLLLTELMPGAVDKKRIDEWTETLTLVMTGVFTRLNEKVTQAAAQGAANKVWPSTDVRMLAAIVYSGNLLNLPKYKTLTGPVLKMMEKAQEADGGVNYSDEQNDCFAYHSTYVTTLARLWQVTGEKAAADLIAATQWYIPLSTGAHGAAEYYTAPSWKQLWDRSTNADAAAIVVGLTGNAYNVAHLKKFAPPPSLFIASFYKDEIGEGEEMPATCLFYDQNIRGPRGRNGDYCYAATGRTTLHSTRGKSTFVGCMVTADPKTLPPEADGFLIDTALAGVNMEVTSARRVDYNQSTPNDLIYLVQRETASTTANSKIAAVTSHHRISAYQHTASEWFVSEAWLLTSERMVGLLSIHALSDQLGCSINGQLKFVSGCGDWGVAREFAHEDDSDTYTYGALTARIVEHDFKNVATSYTNTFNDRARKCGRLVLSSASPGVRMYPLGTGHFFVCEIHPSRFAPARTIERIKDIEGIIGLNVEEANGRTYKLLVNDTSGPVDLNASIGHISPGSTLISSGDAFRPSFLPPIKARDPKPSGKTPVLAGVTAGDPQEGKNAGAKGDKVLDPRLLLRPYRHKIIFSDPSSRRK